MVRAAAGLLFLASLSIAAPAVAQDPLPKIGPFVVDVHGMVPLFPGDPLLATAHDLVEAELPGRGLGLQLGAQVYLFRYRAMTLGVGGELATSRSRKTPDNTPTTTLRSAEEKFRTASGQLSFNFGTGNGWSYISGGLGQSTWSILADGSQPLPSDLADLKTINYGGGARWFAKRHVAFSFDVRFYAINPGPPSADLAGSPRTTLLVIGAGVSLK